MCSVAPQIPILLSKRYETLQTSYFRTKIPNLSIIENLRPLQKNNFLKNLRRIFTNQQKKSRFLGISLLKIPFFEAVWPLFAPFRHNTPYESYFPL